MDQQFAIYNQQRLTRSEICRKKVLLLDAYRQPFSLFLPDGVPYYRSFFGTLLTLFSVLTLLTYAALKFITMAS